MSEPAADLRVVVAETSVPYLPRHVRLQHDPARGRWLILVPERVLVPDETAVEIVQMCDGVITVGVIVDKLAEKYAADRTLISTDVIAMLQDLADKGFLADAAGGRG